MARTKKIVEPAETKQTAAPVEEKPATKKESPAKSLLKKTAAKTAAAKKPVERTEEVILQAAGGEWNVAECKDRALAAYVAEGHRESAVKKLVVYLKPEEGKAYYVINDDKEGSIDL